MNNNNWTRLGRWLVALLVIGFLSGCATTPNGDNDPLEGANRVFYNINDALDRHFIQPVAETYVKYTPKPIRTGATNFFDNVGYLNVIINDFLQGKFRQGFADTGRFVINSTVGILGIFDVAQYWGLKRNDEDLGQTLGVWGAGEGAYLVLPLLGPNSVRDAPDLAMSGFTNLMFHLLDAGVTIPLTILNAINTRANFLEATRIRDEAALDPYIFTREAYRQRRINQIYDGNPPPEMLDLYFDEFDDWEPDVLRIQ